MINELRFALYTIKKNIQSNAELRTSFMMNIAGMALNNISFIILWTSFVHSVGIINNWRAIDIIALEGFSAVVFGVALSFGDGIRRIPALVTSGAFDRFMLAPKNLLIRAATSSFGAAALGDALFGIVCLIVYAVVVNLSLYQIGILILAVIASVILFASVAVTIFSLGFIFTDGESTVAGFFEIFFTPTLFHAGAFTGVLRFVFTFVVPSLVVAGLPVEAVRDMSIVKLTVIVGMSLVWAVLAVWFFGKMIQKYESSNFMTFGN